MARKKKTVDKSKNINENVIGLRAEVLEQKITETLETNYMPYAMSVIVSRAIPEIDGFKPSHRKLLYTMYKMGLLNGNRTKSANIVGQTMRLNPHGDAAIYETMVRLSKGNGALLMPFVDSKGNFGKVYSRDMAYAASRYTEAKLADVCTEIFRDIDKETIDFIDNYDSTMKEPSLLPTAYPNILVSANMGIAVGMASQICGFNLVEVCNTAIALIKNPEHDIIETLPAPDFPTGGEIIRDVDTMRAIYESGRGGFKVRSKWKYVQKENLIEITEIPYTTTVEAIIDKVAELIKTGKVKEVSDMRDETDLGGLKIAIDLKRGVEPEKLMQKLFKSTSLMDSFSCNFNILVNGSPRVMGVREILNEWTKWRVDCVRRRIMFDLRKKREKLHLLLGLAAILVDIDKAIEIIRNTERESDVVPNLMSGFNIDEIQAEYVAEIKLRNINREYLLKRTNETEALEKDIAKLEKTLDSRTGVTNIIVKELEEIIKKYPHERKSAIIDIGDIEEPEFDDGIEDYPVHVFISKENYLKKITQQSLRKASEQKYKDGDEASVYFEATNRSELLVFTDKVQAYKTKLSDFEDLKASQLGIYLPSKLEMEQSEQIIATIMPEDYKKELLFFYENGKVAKIPMNTYETKTNRKKLLNAYCDKSPLVSMRVIDEDMDMVMYSTDGRTLIFNTSAVPLKVSRTTLGVSIMTLKNKHKLKEVGLLSDSKIKNLSRYKTKTLPAAGALLRDEDKGLEQLTLLID